MPEQTAALRENSLLREVAAAIEASNHELASELARSALERGQVHPLFLNLRAWWHERNGRLPQALADLEHAHARAPEDVPVLNALGLCLERLGRTREAANIFEKAAKLAPGFAPAQINMARAREASGDTEAAHEGYERALALGQNVHSALATLAARRADWPRARLHAQQALGVNPGLVSAEHVLAAAEIAANDTATAKGRLSRLLSNAALTPADRATTLSLLGDALDGEGDFASAFAAYETGNAARREALAARLGDPAQDRMGVHLERLLRYFRELPNGAFMPSEADSPGNEEGPAHHVFMLGFARSGTTLLEESLARHPDVVTTQEKDTLAEAVASLFTNEAAFDRLMALKGGGLARDRRAYWRKLGEFGIDTKVPCVVDKQPYNTIRLPLIAKLFPAAKILFCLRDPRDVVLSCFRRRFALNDPNVQLLTLAGAANFYAAVMQLGEIYRAKIPLDVCEVRHEKLVADFDGETRRICDTIGIPWTEAMKDFAGSATWRAVITPSADQLAGGLSARGVGYWRHYREQLEPVLPVLAPWVERFGYTKD
jgi:tetratricopeptide (TPR) repeat protein